MGGAGEDARVSAPRSVLFVCTGNICRSPMAEVVLRDLCGRTASPRGGDVGPAASVQSAGTSNWHAGSEMDPRARAALDAAGFEGSGSLAQQVTDDQLDRADLVVALDRGHRAELARRAPRRDVTVLRWWSEGLDLDVFDPYYGDEEDFARCLGLIVPGCAALARALAEVRT